MTNSRRLALLTALWSIPALLMLLQMQASAYIDHRPYPGFRAIIPAVAEWMIWIPATPIVVALVRRFPVWPRPSAMSFIVHLVGIGAAAMLRSVVYALATAAIGKLPMAAFGQYFLRSSMAWLPPAALVYGAIAAAAVALHYAQEARAGAIRSAELETALTRAESATIRAQLDPHFLFNSLHSAGALVRAQDVTGAVQMLSDIGELLRESFARRGVEQGQLGEELEFARRYLAIEQVRFRDRMVVTWDVDESAREAIVPRSILQPIVENAVRHGIAKRSAAGHIAIRATHAGDVLTISVRDDGPGFNGNELMSTGVGLSATRMRLSWLYGENGRLALTSPPDGGALVEITLPDRPK